MKRLILTFLWLGVAGVLPGQTKPPLATRFQQPPAAARPQTLWMWMNGNVTDDGITRDLEAMRRVGLGGAIIFNIGEYIPKGPVDYGQTQWLERMAHAAREADRLGLQLGMHNGPGWSSSGGPWITPEMSMQQLVWSETRVAGPGRIAVTLPQPATRLDWYQDICVLAFPSLPGEERPFAELLAGIKAGEETVDVRTLTDGNFSTTVTISPQTPLVLEFQRPFEARAITLYPTNGGGAIRFTLEASADGVHFTNVARITPPGPRAIEEAPAVASFDPVEAKFFRVVPSKARAVSEVELHAAARIDGWNYLAGWTHRAARQEPLPKPVDARFVIVPTVVRDVTKDMDASGRLTRDVPPGRWTVVRFGHTTRGQTNIAAPDSGVGLECDKLNPRGVEFHFRHGIGKLLEALGPLAGKSFTALEVDSYEVGMQNWTAGFMEEFEKRNGYSLVPYLPAMTGRYVGSADISARFLWDLRRTLAQMAADNYYGRLRELCAQHRLKLYVEPYGAGPGPYDELQVAGRADVPLGEFWAHYPWDDTLSVRLAASAAHVRGKAVVGAEAFTATEEQGRYLDHPYGLKTTGDLAFALGLNQMFFHRWAHQPHPTAVPGMTMGPWGFVYDRNVTWFEQSAGWLEYLARCQFLLRQGVFVADVLYFTGEGSPQMSKRSVPRLPDGYTFDAIDAETLLDRAAVENGRVVLPDAGNYALLLLPPDLAAMSPEVLRKLHELVARGMILVGPRPAFTPGLRGGSAAESELRRLTRDLWGEAATPERVRAFGRGRVFTGDGAAAALQLSDISRDFEYTARQPDAALAWLHRRAGDADIYFVANRQRRSEDVVCAFRVTGRRAEVWRPDTGTTEGAAVCEPARGQTRVALHLHPAESVFVVFRGRPAANAARSLIRDGATLAEAKPFAGQAAAANAGVSNNFTMMAWIKPETDLQDLPRESVDGTVNDGGKSYVVPAIEGDALYGAGHVLAGIGAGRNGVFVIERSRESAPAVLVSRAALAGWTHLAVVYREGKPALYIDGKLAREGLSSGRVVHPAAGIPSRDRLTYYFDGEMTLPEVIAEALTAKQIADAAAKGLPHPEAPPPIEVSLDGTGAAQALVWERGRYSLDASRTISAGNIAAPVEVAGPWQVSFEQGRGAPDRVDLPKLASLSKHADPGVRYFSGRAIYTSTIEVPDSAMGGSKRVWLDLGRVEVTAEVRLNGRELGVLWKPPFRMDVTHVVQPGTNVLEVRVATLWPNRLIGDEQLPAENEYDPRTRAILQLPGWYQKLEPKPAGGRTTFLTWKYYSGAEPLVESGLLGPVRLLFPEQQTFPKAQSR